LAESSKQAPKVEAATRHAEEAVSYVSAEDQSINPGGIMIVLSKELRVLSAVTLLCLGLFSLPQGGGLASAADDVKGLPCEVPHGQNATRAEHAETKGTHLISGEVLRIEEAKYLVREESGKEVTVKTDQKTVQPVINQGDHISANINDQNYALWIRSNKMTDRRTEHASADCSPN